MDVNKNNTYNTQTIYFKGAYIGYILAIMGNILVSIALNMQKRVHIILSNQSKITHHLHVPFWWLAVILMILGEIGNFVAYGFAPASAVAPLGIVGILFNMIISYSVLSEQIRPEDIYGSALAVMGAVIIISFSKTNSKILNGQELFENFISIPFIIYTVICVITLGAIAITILKFKKHHFILYLLLASISSSFTVVSAKGVSGMFELMFHGKPQWKYPMLYLLIILLGVTAVFQVLMINKGLTTAPASVVVPTNFVFYSASAVISGIIFYQEFEGYNFYHIFLFIFGCLWSFLGVFFFQLNRGLLEFNATQPIEEEIVASKEGEENSTFIDDDDDDEPVWSLGFVRRSYPQPLESELEDVDQLSGLSADPLFSHHQKKKYGAINHQE